MNLSNLILFMIFGERVSVTTWKLSFMKFNEFQTRKAGLMCLAKIFKQAMGLLSVMSRIKVSH